MERSSRADIFFPGKIWTVARNGNKGDWISGGSGESPPIFWGKFKSLGFWQQTWGRSWDWESNNNVLFGSFLTLRLRWWWSENCILPEFRHPVTRLDLFCLAGDVAPMVFDDSRPPDTSHVHSFSLHLFHLTIFDTFLLTFSKFSRFWGMWQGAFYMVEDGARCTPSLPRVMRCVFLHPPQCKTLHVTTSCLSWFELRAEAAKAGEVVHFLDRWDSRATRSLVRPSPRSLRVGDCPSNFCHDLTNQCSVQWFQSAFTYTKRVFSLEKLVNLDLIWPKNFSVFSVHLQRVVQSVDTQDFACGYEVYPRVKAGDRNFR